LRSSFIPPPPVRELRDLTRRRSQLQQDRNRVINRIGRLLETANIKLGSVASDIVGKTGWLILNAIAHGEKDPKQLAERAQGSLQGKKAELEEDLRGYTSEHFRWQLCELLEDVSRLDRKVNNIDNRLRQKMEPHQDLIRRLCTVPGVKEIAAWTLIAELGTDMTQFPTANISLVRPGCVQATAKAPANATPGAHAREIDICAACLFRMAGLLPTKRIAF
jgi:transposase